MTTPTAPAPPTTAPRPGYRDRLRARYATAAEERIDKARTAALELGHTGPVPWEDLRAAYTRPSRTPWKSCRMLLGGALGAALMMTLVVGSAAMTLLSLDAEQKRETTAAAKKTQVAPLSVEQKKKADRALAKGAGKAAAVGFVVTLAFSSYRRMSDKRDGLLKGYVKDGDQVVTEALDALPSLAALASAPAGRTRTEALTDVHEKVSELMTAVTNSADAAGGLQAKYAADQRRLREHGQKVRTAFADKLSELVEDRERAARELGAMVLTVAARQAQAAYGALLDADALPAEPGPEVVEVKGLGGVFAIAGVAAAASLVIAPAAGAEGAGLLFIPLTVFTLAAFLSAAFTRKLHQLGRVVALFGRSGPGAGGVL
ncbi:hypothetical protein [Streptomyces inhibens]|uniref:hypothetical protein n=1 Tax=Streptomyces inhibens TaxID=2293571 RepID=UPI001EE749BD|nr:hypothetical protein [Streptomyces inhibens]UKY47828.1 hypothetical protein KI385_02595 [Streptomyces inhibens]